MDQIVTKQQSNKPMFNVIEPSIVRAQFASNRDIDVSFSSYLQPNNHLNNNSNKFDPRNGPEEADQISIFDAAKYFSGLHDEQHKDQPSKSLDNSSIPPRLSSVSSSVDASSTYSARNSHSNNYRARSFHATPTASSEASWNSQAGLLANPPGSHGIVNIKNFSSNSSGSRGDGNNLSSRWTRMSPKWLFSRPKCPCSGKKSVQVQERIEAKTPRMVDLRQCTSNGNTTLSSPRRSSPENLGTSTKISSSSPSQLPRNPIGNFGCPRTSNDNNNNNNPNDGYSSLGSKPKVIGPLKLYDDLAKVTNTTATATTTSNGFTFPVLENPPIGVKKMFNVISSNHNNNEDPHRDSLEVFQPRSHPSPKSRRTSYEEENGSDGSSDLFEIESFSTNTYPCRDSMDDVLNSSSFGSMKRLGIVCPSYNSQCRSSNNVDDNDIDEEEPMTPSIAPTECYAPSEVSIDWSVTTAEGFDRASLTNFSVSASEFGYVAMRREAEKNGGVDQGKGNNKGNVNYRNGNGGGGLLSCRCEKAVSVGPSPIKCSAQEGPSLSARHVGGRAQGVTAHVHGSGNTKQGIMARPFVT